MQEKYVAKYVQAELDTNQLEHFMRVKQQTHKTVKRLMYEAVELLFEKYQHDRLREAS